jgi:hypothetical protein
MRITTILKFMRRTGGLLLGCTFVGYMFIGCVGSGHSHEDAKKAGPRANYMWIGTVRADRLEEQSELARILEANGIRVDFWGTRLYSILVPSGQEQKALAVLRTNQLVHDQRIIIGTPVVIH